MGELLATIDAWDKAVFAWVEGNLRFPILTTLMSILTNKYYWAVPLLLTVVLLFLKGGRYRVAAVLLLPLIVLSDAFTDEVLKPLFQRPRPLPDDDFSFPSGHATNAFAAATMLAWGVRNWPFRITAFFLAALVAFSRVQLGFHYPADVIAGAAVGTVDALIVIGIYYAMRIRLQKWAPVLFPPLENENNKDV
jgi:undecaprenyl-diphosphatase